MPKNSRLTDAERAAQLYIQQEIVNPRSKKRGIQEPTFRNNLKLFQDCTDKYIILSGPARTGKSYAALYKMNQLALKYPGMRGLIVRKTRESLNESALVTFEHDVLGDDNPIIPRGHRFARHSYKYANGSEIVVAGLQASGKDQRARIMSTQWDCVFVNETTELLEEEWAKLSSRLSSFQMPFQQIIGDCNPDSPNHWVYKYNLGKRVTWFETYLRDNPKWWEENSNEQDGGHWTKEGADVYDTLDRLPGILRERLFEGKWVQASGLVLGDVWSDGPVDGNVTEKAEYEEGMGDVLWFVDDGYAGEYDTVLERFTDTSHPRVFLFVQLRPDGILHVFDEDYRIHLLPDIHLKQIQERPYPQPWFTVVDKSAAELIGRISNGHNVRLPKISDVDEGIKVLMDYLGPDLNKVRKVLVHPRCRNLRMEMASYKRDDSTGKIIKMNDHGIDSLRYGVVVLNSIAIPNVRSLG